MAYTTDELQQLVLNSISVINVPWLNLENSKIVFPLKVEGKNIDVHIPVSVLIDAGKICRDESCNVKIGGSIVPLKVAA